MYTIKNGNMDKTFIIGWLKCNLNSQELNKLELVLHNKQHIIANTDLRKRLEKDYKEFKSQNVTLSHYFQRDIIFCTKKDSKRFKVQWQEKMYRPIFILKKRRGIYNICIDLL